MKASGVRPARERSARESYLVIAVGLFLLALALILIGVRSAGAADEAATAARGRTVTVSVPTGSVVWVCPEAGRSLRGISWRCSTSRRWQAVTGGFSPSCGRVVITSRSTWFDVEVLDGGGSPL